MELQPIYVNRKHRYALERDTSTGGAVFSIPVSNKLVEYSEWYRISETELEDLLADEAAAIDFAARCGRREMDDRLILKPGTDRGVYT